MCSATCWFKNLSVLQPVGLLKTIPFFGGRASGGGVILIFKGDKFNFVILCF